MLTETLLRTVQERVCEQNEPAGDPSLPPLTQSPDEIYTLFSAPRRREIVRYLASELDNGEWVEFGEIAKYVAAQENGKPVDEVTAAERKTVYVAMYQQHLGVLEEADVLDWDERSGEVTRGRSVDALAELLKVVETASQQEDQQ